MTHTPASGPLAPLTVPPRSLAPTLTCASAPPGAPIRNAASAIAPRLTQQSLVFFMMPLPETTFWLYWRHPTPAFCAVHVARGVASRFFFISHDAAERVISRCATRFLGKRDQ